MYVHRVRLYIAIHLSGTAALLFCLFHFLLPHLSNHRFPFCTNLTSIHQPSFHHLLFNLIFSLFEEELRARPFPRTLMETVFLLQPQVWSRPHNPHFRIVTDKPHILKLTQKLHFYRAYNHRGCALYHERHSGNI